MAAQAALMATPYKQDHDWREFTTGNFIEVPVQSNWKITSATIWAMKEARRTLQKRLEYP